MAQQYPYAKRTTHMSDRDPQSGIDTVLDALGNPYRRQLLVALLDHNPQDDDDRDPLDVLSDEEEAKVLESELLHAHLPKLDDMGFITWDRSTNKISKGPQWDEIAPVLKLMHDHQGELPDGWL
jgi:hypothetical protein